MLFQLFPTAFGLLFVAVFLCFCLYMYACLFSSICVRVFVRDMFLYICVSVYLLFCVFVSMYVCVCARVCDCVRVSVCFCVDKWVYVRLCVCVCLFSYRLMIRRVMESGERKFGMCLPIDSDSHPNSNPSPIPSSANPLPIHSPNQPNPNQSNSNPNPKSNPSFSQFGCTAHITNVEVQSDGRLYLNVVGGLRFQVRIRVKFMV